MNVWYGKLQSKSSYSSKYFLEFVHVPRCSTFGNYLDCDKSFLLYNVGMDLEILKGGLKTIIICENNARNLSKFSNKSCFQSRGSATNNCI